MSDIPVTWHRLINSKFPPIAIFDDVAQPSRFTAIYNVQAKTNKRLKLLNGKGGNIALSEVPFQNAQVHAAIGPFVHTPVNESRFSAGGFSGYGVFYAGDTVTCALTEVSHHIGKHLLGVENIAYDTIVLREYKLAYRGALEDVSTQSALHHPDDYTASHAKGVAFHSSVRALVSVEDWDTSPLALMFASVRYETGKYLAAFSPKHISNMRQSRHYSMQFAPQLGLSNPVEIAQP